MYSKIVALIKSYDKTFANMREKSQKYSDLYLQEYGIKQSQKLFDRVDFSQNAFWMFWKETIFTLAAILNFLKFGSKPIGF